MIILRGLLLLASDSGVGFGTWFFLALSVVAVAWIIVELIKNRKDDTDNPNPLTRGIGVAALFYFGVLLYAIFFPDDGLPFMKRYWWIGMVLGITIIGFYIFLNRARQIMEFRKRLKIAWEDLHLAFNLSEYAGVSFWPGLISHNTAEVGTERELRDIVDYFLVYGFNGNTGSIDHALVAINARTGHNVNMMLRPPETVISKLMGSETVGAFKTWQDEFVSEKVEDGKQEESSA